MKTESLHIGMRVRHPHHGVGTVKALAEHSADILFDDGILRSLYPETSDLQPAEAQAALSGLELPLKALVEQIVEESINKLGVERSEATVSELAPRWRGGRLVLHPSSPTLQTKEIDLETFFHKIVMMRNNLRVLEQKLNTHEGLGAVEKFDWQQYITRCYGSMTTFNLLFKDKAGQFGS
jgi:hypothetical protein